MMKQLPTITSELPGEDPVEFGDVMRLSHDVHGQLLDTIQGSYAASGMNNSGAKFLVFYMSLAGVIMAFEAANPAMGRKLRKAIAKNTHPLKAWN